MLVSAGERLDPVAAIDTQGVHCVSKSDMRSRALLPTDCRRDSTSRSITADHNLAMALLRNPNRAAQSRPAEYRPAPPRHVCKTLITGSTPVAASNKLSCTPPLRRIRPSPLDAAMPTFAPTCGPTSGPSRRRRRARGAAAGWPSLGVFGAGTNVCLMTLIEPDIRAYVIVFAPPGGVARGGAEVPR